MKEQFTTKLNQYAILKNAIIEYTEEYYDGMAYDIEGYEECLYNEEYQEYDSLCVQVEAFQLIYEGLKRVKYLFC
jgi:hypothetical protein